jgi:hypothetical protein
MTPEPRAQRPSSVDKDMNIWRLRRSVEERLRDVVVPSPLNVDTFIGELATQRGRPIELLPIQTSAGGPCGLWLATPDTDYVLYEQATDPLHQAHIKLHEWAHIKFRHRGVLAAIGPWLEGALPDLDPGMVRDVLGRRTYAELEEQEAEMAASIILERAGRSTPPAPRRPIDGELGRQLRSVAQTFEGPGHPDA